MISAVILMCSLAEPNRCMGMASQSLFPTEEACRQDRPNAEAYAESLGAFVVMFTCVNWGEST